MRHREGALAAGRDVQAAEHGRPDEVAVGVWSSAVEVVAVTALSHRAGEAAIVFWPSRVVLRARRRPPSPVARHASLLRGPPGSGDT